MNNIERVLIGLPFVVFNGIKMSNRYAPGSLMILIAAGILELFYYIGWAIIVRKKKCKFEFVSILILIAAGIIFTVWCCCIRLSGYDSGGHLLDI